MESGALTRAHRARRWSGVVACAQALIFVACTAPADEGTGRAPVAGASAGTAGMGIPLAGNAGSAGMELVVMAGTTGGSSVLPGACAPDDATCVPVAGQTGMAGSAGMMMLPGTGGTAGMSAPPDGSLDPTTPTCFEMRNHGQPVSGDTSKYSIVPGEQYVCNHFTVPWNEPAEMVSWETLYDNQSVLHHWLLYSVPGGAVDGQFEPCIGTHLLQDAQLVAGWAVGSNNVQMPENVGMRMPGSERSFLLEWHFYNSTLTNQQDGSGIRICVLPAGTREHTAGMTWLGTENFNGPAGMPPGVTSEFSGTCVNDSPEPIHIFRLWPHMHQWGRNMNSTITRSGGASEQVFDNPFDFNYQISYEANITLMPGESIRSTCRFTNGSLGAVAFGPSSNQEMCYQFAFSYPAGALDNRILSLVGATNTCW